MLAFRYHRTAIGHPSVMRSPSQRSRLFYRNEESTMQRRLEQTASFEARAAAFAEGLREKADKLVPDVERDGLLSLAGQADTALRLTDWANSPGLQPSR